VEKQIVKNLKSSGYAAVLNHALRKDLVPTGEVGIVDVDVELGKFHVHDMGGGELYVEAVYTGTADVDVRVRDDSGLPFAGPRAKSLMLQIEVVAEIDVSGGKVAAFDVSEPEIF
jgi:hypothetical protein